MSASNLSFALVLLATVLWLGQREPTTVKVGTESLDLVAQIERAEALFSIPWEVDAIE